MRRRHCAGSWAWITSVVMALTACGGSSPDAVEPAAESQPAPPAEVAPEPTPPLEPEPAAEGPSEEEQRQAELDAAEEKRRSSIPDPRNVVYRVTPNGLIVEIEGARFKPEASVKKLDKGAYGIDLKVIAEATDDRTHTLLSPALGPLSMAAVIYDKKGEEQRRYNDHREGKDQEFLLPGAPLTLERSWPSGEVKGPLWWGQKVRLEVGLWGLGLDGDEGRPVRKLFVVEMVAGNKPRAVITPPEAPTK